MKPITLIGLIFYTIFGFGQTNSDKIETKKFEIKILKGEMRKGSSNLQLDLSFKNATNDTVYFIKPLSQFFYDKGDLYSKQIFEQIDFCYTLSTNPKLRPSSEESNQVTGKTKSVKISERISEHISYEMILTVPPKSETLITVYLDNDETKECLNGTCEVQILYKPNFRLISNEQELMLLEIQKKLLNITESYNNYIKEEQISKAEMKLNYIPAPALPNFILRSNMLLKLIEKSTIKSNKIKVTYK